MPNPYIDGDYVSINRDDLDVNVFLTYDAGFGEERHSPFYGTVQKAIDEDHVQVLCDSGELKTFKRYQLEPCDANHDVVEPEPMHWTESLGWLVFFGSVAFIVASMVLHV
jgi:hypothetical protein